LVAGERLNDLAHERGPREGIASDGAHPVTSSRDRVEPGQAAGTRREGRVLSGAVRPPQAALPAASARKRSRSASRIGAGSSPRPVVIAPRVWWSESGSSRHPVAEEVVFGRRSAEAFAAAGFMASMRSPVSNELTVFSPTRRGVRRLSD
jgi:hypothetical protein